MLKVTCLMDCISHKCVCCFVLLGDKPKPLLCEILPHKDPSVPIFLHENIILIKNPRENKSTFKNQGHLNKNK